MNSAAILNKPEKTQHAVQPFLKDIFIPCPVCHGTLDMTMNGKVICCSCKAMWNLRGEPILNKASQEEDED
ncbi:MAG TPA: hypothetical protein DCX22_04495 [Dehalococcoidia bacterium]|nr:hypothetical protein [Dehalococcoidia bacterium]